MSKQVIDILKMELDQKLPNWLSPEAKNREKMDEIVAKNRAAYWAKKNGEGGNGNGGNNGGSSAKQTNAEVLAEARNLLSRAFDPDEPRDEGGKWTDGGGGSGGGSDDKPAGGGKGEHPGPGYSASAFVKDGVIHTNNVYDAQRALFENKKVDLTQPKQVSTLIKRLGETAKEMAEHGAAAPVFNLCNVSVSGTNLFCADTKGIPRVEMPVIPAKQTKKFIKYLKEQGYKVEKGNERAEHLRATQNEISGAKVAAAMERIKKEGFYKRLVISKDDYILDGHHTWAGQLGIDAQNNELRGDKDVKIARVNISITKLIAAAEKFTGGKGKKPASEAAKSAAQVLGEFIREENEREERWDAVNAEARALLAPQQEEKAMSIPKPKKDAEQDPVTKSMHAKQDDGPEVPDPDDDETENDFMERCVDQMMIGDDGANEDDAMDACQMAWDDRAAKPASIVHKTHAAEVHGMEFILSDESIDRMGDTISSKGWDLENFKKNPIALFNHRSDFPVGKWNNISVNNKSGELRGHLELAPEGTSPRIDEIRKLIGAGILRAVSVGFRALETSPRKSAEGQYVGEQFMRQELIETSLVSVPANPNALVIAKSLDISADTLDLVFAESGNKKTGAEQRTRPPRRASRTSSPNGKSTNMSLSQRIIDQQAHLVKLRDKLASHLAEVDDTDVTDAQIAVTRELNEQIKRGDQSLTALQDAEKQLATRSSASGNGNGAEDEGDQRSQAIVQRREVDGSYSARQLFGMPAPKKVMPHEHVIRGAICLAFAHRYHKSMQEARAIIYPKDEATKAYVDYVEKTASAPAMTTVVGWAAELAQTIYSDFMTLLMPNSVYPRLAAMGLGLSFGRAGRIIIPTRSRTPTIAGSFVGEGQPIPVRQGQFTSQTLVPKKMAVITVWTRELDEHSIPAIEGLLRQAVQEDTAVSLDSVLLDTNPATAVRPAGLFNGITPITAATGGGFTALVNDMKAITANILTLTQGHIRTPVWLMNPQQTNSIKLTANTIGEFPFRAEVQAGNLLGFPVIDSGTVPLGTVGMVDAADFVSVGAEAPRFEISDQATLHMEDSAPQPLVDGGTPAAPMRSLFQTDSLGLRLIMPINWCMRRPITALITGVTW